MAKFHSLIVTDVENTIRDAIVVSSNRKTTQLILILHRVNI